jgi:thiol-disulfide isomerase/thioredoxin
LITGCDSDSGSDPIPPAAAPFVPPTFINARSHLTEGEQIPELLCEGWIHGEPPRFVGDATEGMVVVDVWALWCPFSHATAPGLVRTYEKYRSKNVQFVSLSHESEDGARAFAEQFSMPWPQGYAADLKAIDAIGALNSSVPAPGYEVKPTLYLVSSDGKVLWCDDHARMKHEDPDALIAKLEHELDQRLESLASGQISESE